MRRLLVGIVAALVLAPAASAREGFVTSFDGTKIVYEFYPAHGLAAGAKAPTVLNGPGYSMGHPTDADTTVAALLDHGYNVVTWDPRGFGDSGGNVEIDGPDYEARDVGALMDMIAEQPEAELDKPGDPRIGMIGGSYGGGIQNNTAAIDKRVDVITPQIAWHSLITSLYKNDTAKSGWGLALFGLGVEGSTVPGLLGGPAGVQFGRQQDPMSAAAIQDGALTGTFTPAESAFFASRGPGDLINKVTIPTLITEGTDDTLFTLQEAIDNYTAQRAAGATVHMIWFCGGLTDPSSAHGICLDSLGPRPNIVLEESVKWLDRYLKGDKTVDTGPGFRWVADTGALHSSPAYPPKAGPPVTGSGSGALTLVPGSTSGLLIAAAKAPNAVNVTLERPQPGTMLVGPPELTLAYTGTAPSADGRVYAQLLSDATGRPLGNQVTPVKVTLDGKPHTTTLPIEAVAADAGPDSTYTLQITDGSSQYFAARQAGTIDFSRVKLSVPTADPAGVDTTPAPVACRARHTLRLRVAKRYRHRIRSVRVLAGKKVVGRSHRAAVRVHLKSYSGKVRLRVKIKLRGGKHALARRTVRLCA
ncbi:MAG: type transport system ATP-binding protein [Solirubrobacteraceae bacterium]|jgi:ABC-2 type transport system ATP-binding protein|nr:type transport system ATP-binding protein [Solirubrobacteraceae bacterium]